MYSSVQSININWLSVNLSNRALGSYRGRIIIFPVATLSDNVAQSASIRCRYYVLHLHLLVCSLENIPSVVKGFSAPILLLNFVSLVEFSGSLLWYCYWLSKIISLGQKIHLNIATLDFIPRESLSVWWKEKWIKVKCVYVLCMHSLVLGRGEPTRKHIVLNIMKVSPVNQCVEYK